jgi:hypothetical protein
VRVEKIKKSWLFDLTRIFVGSIRTGTVQLITQRAYSSLVELSIIYIKSTPKTLKMVNFSHGSEPKIRMAATRRNLFPRSKIQK